MIFQPILTDSLSKIEEIKTFCFYKDKFIEYDDPEHIHNCYEIYINVKGDVSFLHNKNVYSIEPGDIIISAPGEVHYCIYHSSCIHKHYCMWFDADENSQISTFINKYNLTGHIRLQKSSVQDLYTLMNKFDSETNKFEKTLCFFELLKFIKDKNTDYISENPQIPDIMKNILEYIDDNYSNIHFIEEIANQFHISIPTLNRWFRQYVHLSPRKLLTAKKLSYSEKLIRKGYSVSDACFTAGFTDCSRFISLFKNKYGQTPLKYKKTISLKDVF